MTLMVPLALFGWPAIVLLLFATLPSRRAAIVAFLFAWMFLPIAAYKIAGLPEYSKMSATCLGVLLGTVLFDPARLLAFRLRLLDIPVLVWCLCPFASSLDNGLGPYDGLSAVFDQVVAWGIPYFIGRIYLTDLASCGELARWLLLGGLIYAPLCLFEIRMSPQLNQWLYGLGGTGIEYFDELGKWGSRPRVFMGTSLTVGLFMTAATLCGVWLWRTGTVRRLWGCPLGALVVPLLLITVLCKNMGALVLLALGLAGLFAVKWWRIRTIVYALIVAPPLYMFARTSGLWSGQTLARIAGEIHERRGQSLQFRLDNEDLLIAKARQRPLFGWGRWGRARVYVADDAGNLDDVTITDGLWIIAFGSTGLVGLCASTTTLLLPALACIRRFPARLWIHPLVAPAACITVLIVLYAIDNLFNAMANPIYLVCAGGLVSLAHARAWAPTGKPRHPRRLRMTAGAATRPLVNPSAVS